MNFKKEEVEHLKLSKTKFKIKTITMKTKEITCQKNPRENNYEHIHT